ncbi:long-chain fatty acid--CoA ligase [Desulfoluna sp.]|uniref:AMP-dependent synthetase/ligase n=1 Tax=Desulfoluna sp. TaxID=2045199 RepID=UPI0026023F00|nr:long-chain fatty acid--CoA ligase [Desulfoluna sp.]
MTVSHHHEGSQAFIEKEQHLALMIRRRIPLYQNKIALKDRADGPWLSLTWQEMGETVDALARALLACGLEVGDRVGIFSQNRAAWTLADLAILSIRGVTVPVYATHSADEAAYIVEDAGIRLLFVNDQDQYDKALSVARRRGNLKTLVAFSPNVTLSPEIPSFSFHDFLMLGTGKALKHELETRLAQAGRSDLYTIIYTSGTTGTPKGVMHTHEGILTGLYCTALPMPIKETDVSLNVLPLSHVFERSWTWLILSRGAENNYCHDPRLLREFFAEVKPHYMVSAPRIWEKFYGSIMEKLHRAPPRSQALFHWALRTGQKRNRLKQRHQPVPMGLEARYRLASRLGLKRIRAVTGGRSKFHHVGGAPLNPAIMDLFCSAGIPMAMGYGLTEIFPLCVCGSADIGLGTSGKPLPLMDVRTGKNGELHARGPCLMKGYWNHPEDTARALTPDGWFLTGDIGDITPEGHLCITDRLKDILITSGGKTISPQAIEATLNEDIYVGQGVIVGDGRPYISALIVPSFSLLESLAEVMELSWTDRQDLITHPEILSFYRYRIDEHTQGLGRINKIKRFALLPSPLTQEAGELTPTLKLKRRVINERYARIIETMYS